jgi:tetratricopeptide (TPR) repeat protein
MLVPVIGLVQVGQQAIADRYTYVPLVGVFVALAWGVRSLAARWRVSAARLSIASGLALGGCILGTELQLHYWRNTESLLKRTIAVTRNNPFAHVVLSTALAQQRRWDEASVEFGKAVRMEETPFAETSIEKEYRVRTHLLLAQVVEMRGHPDQALTHYQDALRLNPASVEAHNNLGNLLQKLGRREDAMAQYREALRAKPDAPLAHVNLGTMLIEIGRVEEGMGEYAEAARLKSEDPLPHYLAAKAWLRHGQSAKAIGEFHEALRRNPDDFQVSTYAARVLAADLDPDVRNGREAAGLAQKANALSGGTQPLVLDTLAMAYAEAGRFEEAQQTMRKAIELAQAAGAQNWIQDMKQRLQLYESGRPYRTASTNLLSTPGVGDRPTRDQSTPSAPGSDSTP